MPATPAEGRPPRVPTASFTHQALLDAPVELVWERLQEAEAWAAIGPIERVWEAAHDQSGALQSFRWSTRAAGRSIDGVARVSAATVGRRMVVDLETSEIAGSLEVVIAAAAIDVTLSLRAVGLLATMFFGIVAEAVGGGLEQHVEDFAAQFGG